MTKRRISTGPPTPPDLAPSRALDLLRHQLEVGKRLGNQRIVDQDEFRTWKNTTVEFIRRAFGSESPNVPTFSRAGDPSLWYGSADQSYYDDLRMKSLKGKIAILKSCIDQLEVMADLPGPAPPFSASNSRVFLVHGRNEGVRESVARFIEKLDLNVTILHERPNRGRTIIEKFEEECSDVGFAVILLTGDDRGGLADAPSKDYQPRARQNVILELGFFLGKLGRDRVCALYERGVEIPSDFSGVVFVELDDNKRWHVELAKEIKAAGFAVDMNKAF